MVHELSEAPVAAVTSEPDEGPALESVAARVSTPLETWRRRDRSLGTLLALARLERGRRAAHALVDLGDLRFERGELAEARECWSRAAELDRSAPVSARLEHARAAPAARETRPAPPVSWARPGNLDPRLVAATGDGVLVATGGRAVFLDASSGAPRDELELEGRAAAVAAREGVFVLVDSARATLLDPSGRRLRSFDLDDLPGEGPVRAAALQDDVLVLLRAAKSESYATLVGIDLDAGRARFETRILATESGRRSVVLTLPGRLVVATEDELASFDLGTGTAAWVRAEVRDREDPARRLRVEGRDLLVSREQGVEVLDLDSGARRGRRPLDPLPRETTFGHPAPARVLEVPGGSLVASSAGVEVVGRR